MKKTTYFALILALLIPLGAQAADELPAQAVRIWAPDGDLVGMENHATGTFQILDPHGDDAKRGEDWQLADKYAGSGLFNWYKTYDSGYHFDVRGYATSEAANGLAGHLLATGGSPGKGNWRLRFRNADHMYDRDSEMRAPGFKASPAPPVMDILPEFSWRMTDLTLGHRFGDAWKLRLGFNRWCRKGDKGSLLRVGAGGDEVPGVKMYDTTSNEVWGDVVFATGRFTGDVRLGIRGSDGDRALDDRRVRQDDRSLGRFDLGLRYDFTAGTSAYATGSASNLKDQGTLNGSSIDSEAKQSGGQLGLSSRIFKATTLRLAGAFRNNDTEGAVDGNQVERNRSSSDIRAALIYAGLTRTRLELKYRYRQSDMDQTSSDGVNGLKQNQEQKRNQLDFRGRYRFSRAADLRLRIGWLSRETDNVYDWTDDANAWYTGIPERKRNQVNLQLILRTRPARTLRLDLGYRGWARTIERPDQPGIETAWQANQGFLNLDWQALPKLSLRGNFSYGINKYELSGPTLPDAGMGPFNQDADNLRFAPGLAWQIVPRLALDAMYEIIRYEDTGDVSATIDPLQSDHDRALVRAIWAASDKVDVTGSYRRQEFFEHRWDNYISDLYAVSVGGRF